MRIIVFLIGLLGVGLCQAQKQVPDIKTFDDLVYPFATQKISLADGIEIAYADLGKGEKTILFIHGLGSYGPAWKHNVAELQQHYRCLVIDLPGYGKSSKGNYEGGMPFFAKAVKDFGDALGLEKVVLAGHSMGGQIAIVTALAYPDWVDELILVAPAGFETFNKGQKEWFREVITYDGVRLTTVDQIKENMAWNFYNMPKDAEFMITDRIAMRQASDFSGYCHIIPQSVIGMVDTPVFDDLPQVKAKTLVVYGENDNLIPNRFLNPGTTEAIARQGAERIPNCRLEMVAKAGHFVHFEQANTVNQLMLDFLKEK
ncbi:MAG TPA: alpha/beta hydrolase [Saprospiraceae bacterium]|nr:alpha/beta hydrolase [Saprospiraceae bacterium]HMQ81311.1 alpha/beta hydrolase [Saprospiraceae bacterium]